jgi:hypothetical protein
MVVARRWRPSPALVISFLALTLALGGGAFALSSSDRKTDRRIATGVAKKVVRRLAPKLSVRHATTAGDAATADHATTADHAATADHATTADDSAALGGAPPSAYVRFKRIVLVQAGGTPADNAAALRAALAGIGDASASNRYLVKVEPGTYDLGATPLQMKPNVDVEGSGIDGTTLTGALASNTDGVVDGAASSELRFLTVANTGVGASSSAATAIFDTGNGFRLTEIAADASGTPSATGIRIQGAGAVTFDDVHATASGTGQGNGIARGILLSTAPEASLSNVVATAQGGDNGSVGINLNGQTSATMDDVSATGQGLLSSTTGMFVGGGGVTSSVIARNSAFVGATNSIATNGGGNTAKFGASELSGPVSIAAGDTVRCAQSYKGDFTEANATCG